LSVERAIFRTSVRIPTALKGLLKNVSHAG
jgi:hypothetical protein